MKNITPVNIIIVLLIIAIIVRVIHGGWII